MHTEFLIIGQGISGTFLGWNLQKANRSFITIDNGDHQSASRVAAGIINPVTGRRIVKTWMIDELLPFALQQYQLLGDELGIVAVTQKNTIDFFPSPQMLIAFRERIKEDTTYLSLPDDTTQYRSLFNYDFGYGEITPCYAVNLYELLPAWRKKQLLLNRLMEEDFNIDQLIISDSIQYKDITADKIIFCDGIQTAENPFFKKLPFAINKGEALLIEADGIPANRVFKKALHLIPVKETVFWAGSSYEWNFDQAGPSEAFRDKTMQQLKSWIKSPFKLLDHIAALRPATIERRPFVGIHPHHTQVAILNGMGTKGCSLAPYFADQLVNLLISGIPVLPEANINRFTRILH